MADAMAESLRNFYKGKENPKMGNTYGYDEEGNLEQRDKEGKVIQTIPLPSYRPPTHEEWEEMDRVRNEAIQRATHAFKEARMKLHQEYQKGASTPIRNLIQSNKEVWLADIARKKAQFPLYHVSKQEGIEIRDIDFTQPNEIRKMIYPIAMVETNPYPLQEQYVRVGQPASKPSIPVAEIKEAVPVIRFSDADHTNNPYGFLSLAWPVTIQIQENGMMVPYASARHAIFANMAREFNEEERASAIMNAETAEEIHYSVEDIPGGAEVNQEKWNHTLEYWMESINRMKYKQYPELRQRLEQTYPSVLGAYEPNDTTIGMGIPLDNPDSSNPLKWTGQNGLGKALMKIREEAMQHALPVVIKKAKRPTKIKLLPKAKPVTVEEQKEPVEEPVEEQKEPVEEVKEPIPRIIEPSTVKRIPRAAKAAPVAAPVVAPVAAPVVAPVAAPVAVSAPRIKRPVIIQPK